MTRFGVLVQELIKEHYAYAPDAVQFGVYSQKHIISN